MTEREKEILQWITQDPFLSQEEIAKRAGIARSSAAVHISNLVRKGKIKGRGYILEPEEYITVVGGANIDISGTSYTPILEEDSNPGHVSVSLGGVGRNIADNLCRLGARVSLITAMGEDSHAEQIRLSCRELGIDLKHSRVLTGERTSTYLCINDSNGEMRLAVSDMEICRHITPDYVRSKLEFINRSALVVMDANLCEETIAYLTDHCTAPLFVDPVSTKKAVKLKEHLRNVFCLKPNRIEAELLSGVSIHDEGDLQIAADAMHHKGVGIVFISLGAQGVYYDDGKIRGIHPCYSGPIENTTGCGDAFMAAVAYGYQSGKDTLVMTRMGLAAAALCAETAGAVRQDLSYSLLENRCMKMEEMNDEA